MCTIYRAVVVERARPETDLKADEKVSDAVPSVFVSA
jgi:hypothetical protein